MAEGPAAIRQTSQMAISEEDVDIPRAINHSRSQATSAKKRDAKGRFSKSSARQGGLRVRSNSRTKSEPARQRKGQSDLEGRFSSHFVNVDDSPITSLMDRPRGRSRERSNATTNSANASTKVVADANERLCCSHLISGNTQPNFMAGKISDAGGVEKSRSRSRSINAQMQRRDSKGRFSSVRTTEGVAIIEEKAPEKIAFERRRSISAASQKSNSKGQFSASAPNLSPVAPEGKALSPAALMAINVERIPGDIKVGRLEKKLPKGTRSQSKSPYFATGLSLPATDGLTDSPLEGYVQTPKKRTSSRSPKTPKTSSGEREPKNPRTPHTPRTPGGIVSCIPFPPLSEPYFGLIQEKLAHDPFRLLIAVTFLIRTQGKHAIPVFYELMERYPTPESLAAGNRDDIVPLIRHLGLQNQRAATYQMYAKVWLEDPPAKGRRYAVRDYPTKGAGKDIKKDEILTDEDERVAWEIGHMTQGPYAIDSWRIFCRDVLRGVANGWNGEGAKKSFQPEWMRVLPEDKELRAYLRWMWLKEGFEWDPFTGEREVASERLMRAAIEGRIVWDDMGGMRILDNPNDDVQG